jgi:hypothetical protein
MQEEKENNKTIVAPHVQTYVDAGYITIEAALELNPTQEDNLKSRHVRHLIDTRTITFDQGLNLTMGQRMSLATPAVRQSLMRGQLDPRLAGTPNIQAILESARSKCEIKKNAYLLCQAYNTQNSNFFKLPKELCITISSLTGNNQFHDKRTSSQIAEENFCKPKTASVGEAKKSTKSMLSAWLSR